MSRTIDDLEVFLSEKTVSTARFDALLELDDYLSQKDFQRSVETCREALRTAIVLESLDLMAKAHLKLSTALWKVGDTDGCLSHALKGLHLCEQTGHSAGAAQAYCTLGIAHGILDNHAPALDFFEKSAKIAGTLGERLLLAHVLGNIGSVYRSLSDFPSALDNLNRSLEIFRQLGDDGLQGVSNILEAMAGVMVSQGEFEGALAKINEALNIDERTGNLRGKTVALHNLGIIYLKWGRHADAVTHLRSSLALSERIQFLAQKADTHLMLSRAYQTIGETQEALHHLSMYHEFGKEQKRQRLSSDHGRMNVHRPQSIT
jgi:tetratricopeptide (TPR) repeat protein